MKPDVFYVIVKNQYKSASVVKIQLGDKQTIITTPIKELARIHTTNHQPDYSQGYHTSVFHVRENADSDNKTLLRVVNSVQNPTLQDLGQFMIDLDVHFDDLKEFRKRSFTDYVILDKEGFGKHLTIYLFQGKHKDIENHAEKLLKTKKATIIAPNTDGFRIVSPRYPVKCALGVFQTTRPVTIGFLALGSNPLNENASLGKRDGPDATPITYIAFGKGGKRKIGKDP